jgi:hypothetical protein
MQVNAQSSIVGGCFAADSRLAVTYSAEGHVAVWHIATTRALAFFAMDATISRCLCLQNGVLVAGGTSGDLHFMQLPSLAPADSRSKRTSSVGASLRILPCFRFGLYLLIASTMLCLCRASCHFHKFG